MTAKFRIFAITMLLGATTTLLLAQDSGSSRDDSAVKRVPVVFSGGFDTDQRDHGRPVALIAAALGVTPEIFREAFSRVRPARPDRGPTRDEATANKEALLSVLEKYGVNNEQLDEISNLYRYNPAAGEHWRHTPAVANALVKNGAIVGYEIISGGAGYSSAPRVTVPNMRDAEAKVELSFGKNLKTNGCISAIKPAKHGRDSPPASITRQ